MYHNQIMCAEELKKFTHKTSIRFDAVINNREDSYYLAPFNVSKLFPLLKSHEGGCDLLFKNCLTWGGLSMRSQMLDGSIAISYLESRISYFKHMMSIPKGGTEQSIEMELGTVEKFEKYHAEAKGLVTCNVSIEDLPAAAARLNQSGQFCLIEPELRFRREKCYPDSFDADKFICRVATPASPYNKSLNYL